MFDESSSDLDLEFCGSHINNPIPPHDILDHLRIHTLLLAAKRLPKAFRHPESTCVHDHFPLHGFHMHLLCCGTDNRDTFRANLKPLAVVRAWIE